MGFYRDFEFTIYAVIRASDKLVLYIGQTSTTLNQRLIAHLSRGRKAFGRLSNWERWLKENPDEKLEIVALEHGRGVSVDAHAKEREMIHAFICAGVPLLNSHNGVTHALRRREGAYAPMPPIWGLSGLLTVF